MKFFAAAATAAVIAAQCPKLDRLNGQANYNDRVRELGESRFSERRHTVHNMHAHAHMMRSNGFTDLIIIILSIAIIIIVLRESFFFFIIFLYNLIKNDNIL